ncbi:DUF1801 domain-containing protein [Aliisedimentitalea scapharcae]|uniref:DUF1801 domain-containing protein n=1 Tax=Aliisedimentitalea scapharcae TaxID=1524259 RepID=A0ABZ2XWB8_9RHOB
MKQPFSSDLVQAVFDSSEPEAREGMLALRQLIFETAANLPKVGPVTEALRWGQPSYITEQTKSGTPIRLGVPKTGGFALFVHCQSRVIPEFQQKFPAWDRVEGTRAVLFSKAADIESLRHGWLVERALTYKLTRRSA